MDSFFYYLLRASVVMILFYGIYKLLWSKVTFHATNRITLILSLMMIMVIPLFQYHLLPERSLTDAVPSGIIPVTDQLLMTEMTYADTKAEIPWVTILSLIYLVGLMFFLLRYLYGLYQLILILHRSEKRSAGDGTIVCLSDKGIEPFSWFRYMVMSATDYSTDESAIWHHENAHGQLRHSVDRTLFDLFTCFFWFNPFAWLLRHELQAVHEFQADEQVLQRGVDMKQYQFLLIRRSAGEAKFAMANNFLRQDLQKRISMMMKNKTNLNMKWSYAIGFPVMALVMILLSVPKLNATVSVDKPDKNDSSISGNGVVTMYDRGGEDGTGVNPDIWNPAEVDDSRMGGLSTDTAKNKHEDVETLMKRVKIRLKDGTKAEPIYIVDDVKVDNISAINPDKIESISVLKDKSATALYGEDGKNGVILITTKKQTLQVQVQPDNKSILFVDGIRMPEDHNIHTISPDDIALMSVLKDKSATDKYGVEAKNGVILIMTKNNLQSKVEVEDDQKRVLNVSTFKSGEVLTFGDFSNAVIFIDGKKSSLEQLQQLHSGEIKGMAASPSNLDFESDLHKKYSVPRDKIILEISR